MRTPFDNEMLMPNASAYSLALVDFQAAFTSLDAPACDWTPLDDYEWLETRLRE